MPRVKLFNEEEVLQKSMNLFWKKGYADTSIQDLVTHLGINRGSLYATYGGKKELFNKAFKKYRNDNNALASAFFDKQKSVKEGFLKFFEIPLNAAITEQGVRGCFVVNTITEMLPHDEFMQIILENNQIALEKMFYDFLQKGVISGEIDKSKDLKKIASFLYALLNGILVTAKINFNKKALLETAEIGLAVLD